MLRSLPVDLRRRLASNLLRLTCPAVSSCPAPCKAWTGSRRWSAGTPQAEGHPTSEGTVLGQYLQSCGAVWGDAYEVDAVAVDESRGTYSWRVHLPEERLASLRPGEALESPTFQLPNGGRGRFQVFPKGDAEKAEASGFCSLWLCADTRNLGKVQLKLGSSEVRSSGASEFCRLEEALANDGIEVSLQVEQAVPPLEPVKVEQSLRLTGLELAEWQLFQATRLKTEAATSTDQVISSPPFRFHHVLLGDMYLELLPGAPHPEHCLVFFRCRVPTMQLRVNLSVGSAFSKSVIALGRSTVQDDLVAQSYLQVNLDAPGVLSEDGSLNVRCSLEEVMQIPLALRDMIPKLDERANWPKRI
mmetsp:Transcript_17145/g.30063  ORF Transcript_17145/g.30063 Transcript_17145/m.30063 type:complete len:359 (+) Transcript_17145:32-1108(+)